jgi:hypothetical protein
MRDHIFSRASSLEKHQSAFALLESCSSSPSPQHFLLGAIPPLLPGLPPNPVKCSLLLPNSLSNSVKTVRADSSDCDEVVGRTEAANGQVAAVLHGLVAAGGRHVLRHFGGLGALVGALENDSGG